MKESFVMSLEKISFKAIDGVDLEGILYKANTRTEQIIVSIHGMTSNCFKKREDIIAKYATNNNIDYLAFNNRGHDIMSYITKNKDGKKIRQISGTSFEDILDSYYDIKGALQYVCSLGYTRVYIQGHSLGCTKIIYAYNKMRENKEKILEKIESIILLSLIDIPKVQEFYLGKNFDLYLKYAESIEKEGKTEILMPRESFIHPISVKTYLRYFKYNNEINFARYSENNYDFVELNNIRVPLFMRWGTDNEMIIQKPDELCTKLKNKIKNNKLDVDYIDGANHGYNGKEDILAGQIINFIKK